MATGTLTGQTIANTYKSLLKVTGTTSGGETLHATTLKVIEDGDGNPSPIQLAQNRIEIVPTANHANAFEVSNAAGTQIFNINSSTPGATLTSDEENVLRLDGLQGNIDFRYGSDIEFDRGDNVYITANNAAGVLNFRTGGQNIRLAISAAGSIIPSSAGTLNTHYGDGAGDAIQAGGNYNTLIGHDAGGAITTGDANVLMGDSAGDAINIGVNNCAIGNDALTAEDVGNNSTAIGNAALASQNSDSNNEVTENTGVGYAAGYYNVTGTGNTSVGYYSLVGASGQSNSDNTALGGYSGYAITTGGDNVIVGYRSGDALTTGSNNAFLGKAAGGGTTDVDSAVCIGWYAGAGAMTDAADGTIAIGHQSGTNITSGVKNIAIGYQALYTEDTGDFNIAIGYKALEDQNVDGTVGNVAVGYQCGKEISSGVGNVGMGYNAMGAASASAMTGTGNICIGQGAGYVLTSADKNVIIGYESGIGQTTADSNVLIGYLAGRNITTGSSNVFIGESSGGESASNSLAGGGNVGVGRNSLRQADGDMEKNTAIGFAVLEDGNNNSVLRNTGVGYAALNVAGTGGAVCDNNVALGTNAGVAVTSGDANAFIGTYCGDNITSGNYNTYLGYNCEASADSVDTEIAIGNGLTGGGTETVRIGISSDYITCDFGENATWGHSSDKRIKKDIEDNSLGLEFVKKLRTVTFTKKAPSEYPKEFEQYDENVTERKYPNRKNYGFIAQEVKKAMDEVGHSEFPVWKENRDGMQELGEAELITPLVKAVQELSAKVEELESKLNN